MSKKPKGFKAFDSLMQKPVKVPVPVRLTVAQENVLKRLMVGWVLDHHGKNAMQGFLTRGRGETAVVSSKTMGFLLSGRIDLQDHWRCD